MGRLERRSVVAQSLSIYQNGTMIQEQWTQVDQYITDLFVRPDPVLDAALQASAENALPAINVAANQGKLLAILAQLRGARNILEIGTLGAYSAIWMARALPRGGRLITLEADAEHARVARLNIARAGLESVIDLREGPALETLPELEAEGCGPFDIIFIDADKPAYPEYLTWALRLSCKGTLIIADNIVRNGDVIDPAHEDPRVHGARRFNELLAEEPRVSATAIQTVGSKGYDGFAMALVIADR